MVEIVEYKKEYTEKINKMTHEILVKEYGFDNFSEGILNSSQEEFLEEGNKLWLAIEEGEIIATMGILKIDDKNALLKRVYAKQEYRGQGISQKMLSQCIEYAILNLYQYIHLETYQRLERAIKFYQKNGFEEYDGEYEKEQGEEIRYTLDLKKYEAAI